MASTLTHPRRMGASDWDGRVVRVSATQARRFWDSGEWSELPTGARLHAMAERQPDRLAVITADEQITYGELDVRTDQIAAALIALGLGRRAPIIFQLTNRLGTVLAWYGAIKAGAIPEVTDIARRVGAVGHIVEAGLGYDLVDFARRHAEVSDSVRHILSVGDRDDRPDVTRLESLGVDLDPDQARAEVEAAEAGVDPLDVVAFQLSGGTTGTPKVIPRLHAEYWNNGLFYARHLGWDRQTRVAHLIPLIHNAGISCALHGAHSVGACLVLATADAPAAFSLMARTGATDVLIGHGHYQSLMLEAFEPARVSLRRVVLSGAKVPPELFSRVDGDGRWAGQMFGMSEGLFLVSPTDAPVLMRQTTVGVPVAKSDEVRILAPDSETEVEIGEIGELCARGPYTIAGYFDAPEHNARAFTSDGFYRTGDLAKLTLADGRAYVSIEGRIKDLINRGGEKINAEEVETLLLTHPRIRAAAVVAMPDPRLGERTCAFVVAAGDRVSLEDLRDHLTQIGVAKFKWPERLEWLEEIPLTKVGKLDKKRLRDQIRQQLLDEAGQEPADQSRD
jgi:2,3-dihydroxybenzoate-AMP ligase